MEASHRKSLQLVKLRPLAVVPCSVDLAAPRVLDVAQSLKARVVFAGEIRTRRVSDVGLCAANVPNALRAMRPGALIITPGDRSDIMMAAALSVQSGTPLADLAEVQGALGPDIVLLAFQLGLRHSYLLLVDGARAKVFELPDRRTVELAALPVAYYCSRSSSQSCARFRAANQVLVEHLFGALDAAIGLKAALSGKHVLIAPDGILHYLPFEALLVDAAHDEVLRVEAAPGQLRWRHSVLCARRVGVLTDSIRSLPCSLQAPREV